MILDHFREILTELNLASNPKRDEIENIIKIKLEIYISSTSTYIVFHLIRSDSIRFDLAVQIYTNNDGQIKKRNEEYF